MNRENKVLPFLAAVLIAAASVRCAHQVTPTGGPKDVTPPAYVESEPPNYSTLFTKKKIVIDFNEYIVLKDVSKEIFTSPPMVNKPEYFVRGRSVVVEISEGLREDATYVIYFGNAITDLTEGNALKGFSYVFSTGSTIDSMILAGKVSSAFDMKPAENIVVSVYSEDQDTIPLDSMPLKLPPVSAIKTSADGSFILKNLPDRKFLLIALEDLNNNFYYDLPEEKIGFLDSLVTPEYVKAEIDTARQDSTGNMNVAREGMPEKFHEILLFQEVDSTQRLLSASFSAVGCMQLAYRLPVRDLVIMPLNFTADQQWCLEEFNSSGDSLKLWPKETERDTFQLLLTLSQDLTDTVKLIRKKADTGGSRKKTVAVKNLEYRSNIQAGVLEPLKDLILTFPEPIVKADLSNVQLGDNTDTILVSAVFTDSIKRRLIIGHPWQVERTYSLIIPDSVLTGLSGKKNREITQNFRTKPYSDYGTLIMDYVIQPGTHPVVVEMYGDKDVLIRRDTLQSTSKIVYSFLKPGPVRIKAIYDENHNGRWDTGNYGLGQLPERVAYFNKEITIRSNWELQEEWKLIP